jgi:hypothetical protein
VGVHWLAGRALDLAGDGLAAEAELRAAVALDPDHPLAGTALAAFAADRGDAALAVRLLRRAGVTGDGDADDDIEFDAGAELLEEVAGFTRARPSRAAGRNDPCPCGSGRKYKVCHLGRERAPLADRASWLYAKARRYLRDNRFRPLVLEVAQTIEEASGRSAGFLLHLVDSELTADLVLCEAGVFEDFVRERHELLPDDEALLAASWQLVERSLFEVEGLRHDELDLRDLRTGDRITVSNVTPSDRTTIGTRLLGRPLPVEGAWRALSGFIPVGALVDEVLDVLDDPDPFVVADLTGRLLAPPRIQNTDGQDLVFHEVTYALADRGAAWDAFRASTLDWDGDTTFSLLRSTASQSDTVIATFELDADRLLVSANSDERLAEAEAIVTALVADATLVDHERRGIDEVMADAEAAGPAARIDHDPDDPALVAVLEAHVRTLEQRWVDEPVPALGNRTPREAAADPIGRHELDRLLRTFDGVTSPGAMSAARLRGLLGM